MFVLVGSATRLPDSGLKVIGSSGWRGSSRVAPGHLLARDHPPGCVVASILPVVHRRLLPGCAQASHRSSLNDMRFHIAYVALLLALLFASGCSADSGPTLADLADATGCAYVSPAWADQADVRVLRVAVRDCEERVTDRDDAERVAAAAWWYLRRPVDRVDVTSYPTITEPMTVTFRGDDLAERYLVNSLPRRPGQPADGNNSPLWLLLPISYVATGVAWLIAVRRLRRAGIVLVVIRR